MIGKVFDPLTMTKATQADVDRMWKRLWRDLTYDEVLTMTLAYEASDEEPRDFTQI